VWIVGRVAEDERTDTESILNASKLYDCRETPMDKLGMHALHWKSETNRWEEIGWDEFLAFRELCVPFKPLPDVTSGIHHFVVCVCGEGQTHNIIPHKYWSSRAAR
jgi:hypothetical protein